VTARSVLIVADDLTGACDTAGAVVAISGSVRVRLDGRHRAVAGGAPDSADGDVVGVTAIDLDSRAAPVAHALARTIDAVAAAPGDVYLKIDSTLRGHVVPTVAAAVGAFRARHPGARVVVCPAFPARGRLVVGRRVLVDGRTLESGVLDDLAALPGVEVADAASDDDLAALAGGGVAPTLWVGSAGLAPHAVRAVLPAPPAAPLPRAALVTVVVGSEQPVSVGGAGDLSGESDDRVRVVVGDPRRAAFVDEALEAVRGADALVVTGGYTARRLLDRLDVTELRVCGELEPGIPWCTSDGPVPTIVTKAGGFGDVGTLRRLVDSLRRGAESA
jgi:D-threonate/D-erythronate kinase